MIDTISFSGTLQNSHFEADLSKYYVSVRKDGKFWLQDTQQQKGFHYFCRYQPSYDRFTVELNLHKVLFEVNAYNYCQSPTILNDLVRFAGEAFFLPGKYHVKRIDIGGVKEFADYDDALNNLETYRNARADGFSLKKAIAQNYAESAWYPHRNWSAKIYHKGLEQGFKKGQKADVFPGIDLARMLRFEKTYRPGELKRLGLYTIPWHGVPIRDFNIIPVLNDFYELFQNWKHTSVPYVADGTGLHYLINIADNNGNLKFIEQSGRVSRSTIYRYRKAKQASAASRIASGEVEPLIFKNNLTPALAGRFSYLSSQKVSLQREILAPKPTRAITFGRIS